VTQRADNKLLIYAPYAIWGPHFQTDLELAQEHLDAGGEVTFVGCRGELLTCFPNPDHKRSICRMCISRFEKGMRWLGRKRVTVVGLLSLTTDQQQVIDDLSKMEPASCQDVEEITVDGVDIGVAAISSVISLLREPRPDVATHLSMIRLNLISAARTYFSILNHLRNLRPDRFILFNGRYAQLRPALSAAQKLSVETYVHERAGVLERYSLTRNNSTHDLETMKEEILRISRNSDLSVAEREQLACQWYEERRNNKIQAWESFTAAQRWGYVPELSCDKVNLVIFNSSEDELETFKDWRNPLYRDQNQGIELIVSALDCDRFRIFLREHPNLTGIDNSQTRRLRELAEKYPQLTVIPAESLVSTYSLLDSSDVVLTFGSTVGIEAVYSKKPSFLMGRAFYEHLGCCISPSSHDELISLLNSFATGERKMLPSQEVCRQAVIIYGLYNKLWGRTFHHVKIHGLRTASMIRDGKERYLRPSFPSWLMYKTASFLRLDL